MIRPATGVDRPFLWEALTLAINWRDAKQHMTPEQVRQHPGSSHYVTGWPGNQDAGFLALDPDPVGAAWWRFFSVADPGYGFVDASIPEVGIAVVAHHRGKGIGTELLGELIDEARDRDLPGLSLSVQLENPALRLYERCGFSVVAIDADSATMLLTLQ